MGPFSIHIGTGGVCQYGYVSHVILQYGYNIQCSDEACISLGIPEQDQSFEGTFVKRQNIRFLLQLWGFFWEGIFPLKGMFDI